MGAGRVVPDGWDCHVHVFDGAWPAAAGHYQPPHRPLADIERLAEQHGVGHLVLVQPSVYGTDNHVMLEALRGSAGRHRGVAVVEADVSDAALQDMHALGVRGVRFNLVSPVGNRQDTGATVVALAPRLRDMGWHVQWYAAPDDLPLVAQLHAADAASGVPAVLDHLAGMHANLAAHAAAWQAIQTLADGGAWLKLSGWYRLQADAPYETLDDTIDRLSRLFTGRMVWGSDWPHTSLESGALLPYAGEWAPVARVVAAGDGAIAQDIRRLSPPLLYG